MKLETSFRMIAATGLTLIVWTSACNTRTPIGEIPDAGDGNDGSLGDGSLTRGSGGVAGDQGGGGGGYPSGNGGALATGGDTGASGGVVGNGGGRTGQGGAAAGGSPAMGGAPGTVACLTYDNASGVGGQGVVACSPFVYPASGFYGDNILAGNCTSFTSSVDYELGVMGTTSATVQVTLTALSLPGAGGRNGSPGWGYGLDGDWRVTGYDPQTQQQIFQTRPLPGNETMIKFRGTGSARVDIYECDLNTPARSKTITWAPPSP